MCGVVGILNFEKTNNVKKKVLSSMTNSIAHRGPDDSGTIILKNAGLGNRRLAIIDLSEKGHMPMHDEKKELWITFNGEIYNYMEIRKELLGKNYKFISNTDTEAILKSYKEWGPDCLKKFNGMFAFAIYDTKKNELFIARDRLGVKPLYYSKLNGALVFASEIKAILRHPGFKRRINLMAVSSYLSYRYELGTETLFQGIFKLMPGHYMVVKGNILIIKEYWDINLSKRNKGKSFGYYKKELKRLLEDSVKLRMISDVPIGAYLSGGLDSSIVVALMSKNSNRKIKTFSIGFKEQGYNEFEYARQVAKMYNTEHKEILLSLEDYIKTMKVLIRYKDLPLGVPNEVPLYLMSKELRKYITVVLSGEGADEIFSGYGRIFRSPLDYKKLSMIKHIPFFLKKSIFKQFMEKYGNRQFASEMDHFLYNYSYFPFEEKKLIFNSKINKIINNDKFLTGIFSEHFNKAKDEPYYKKIWYVFEKLHLPGLLQRLDCTTMAASVEGRTPFVDYRLVEFMFTVPSKYKMKWKSFLEVIKSWNETSDEISEKRDKTKYLLRETFRNILPKAIVERKKQGFPVPLDVWFRGSIGKFAKKELLNSNSKIRMIVNQKNLEKWIDSNLKNSKDSSFGQKLWMLLNLEYWLREYF